MKIKNYTSSVPVDRSVLLIEKELVEAGACLINKIYKNGKIEGIQFQINDSTSQGHMIPISLPARVNEVHAFFVLQKVRCDPQQAERTAWKSLLEWVQIQMSFVKMKRADLLEVFLPYVWRGDKTYYQEIKGANFLALENNL